MKGMHGPWRRVAVALGSVVGAYLLYAQFAIPWIEGPPKRLRESALATFEAPANPLDLARWLPADAWELQPCKRLDTTLGHLLFQDYLPHDDGRVEVQPLTILFRPAGDPPDAPPIVLRSTQGAVLKFDGPLSLSGKTGQLEGGMFFGPVEIFRQATGPEQHDDWRITTSDVQLNNERIQTLQDVAFQFGPNRGQGRHLIVTLDRDPLRAGQRTMSAVRGASRIELVQIRELLLEAPAQQLANPPAPGATPTPEVAAATAPTTPTAVPVRVTCSGSLVVEIAAGLGYLSDNVELVSLHDPRDWLRADRLELTFAGPGQAANVPASSAATAEPNGAGQWAMQSVAALGRPAQINFPSRQMSVSGDRLSYDFARNAVRIVNSTPQALRQGNLELTARDLEYTRLNDGTVGPTEIRGPGRLLQTSEEGQPPVEFSWQQGLSIENLDSEKKLTVRGQVSGSLDPTTTLETDQVELWFRQRKSTADNPAAVELLKMIATGNVHIAAERLDVRVQQLLAHWPTAAASGTAAIRPAIARSQYVGSGAQESGTQPTDRSRPAPAAVGGAGEPPAAAAPLAQGAAPGALPLFVRGDVATIRFADRPQTPAATTPAGQDFPPLEEITIDGKVLLQQKNPLTQEVELEIEGEQLNVIPQDATHRRAVVRGRVERPVVITASGFTVRGTKVTVDQLANRLWMDGAGQLDGQLAGDLGPLNPNGATPRAVPARPSAASGDPHAIRTLQLTWLSGMVFDGQQIYFECGVEAHIDERNETGLARTWVHCEAMNLTLEQRIDLSGEGGSSTSSGGTPQAAIQSITLARDIPAEQRVFPLAESDRTQPQPILERQVFDLLQTLVQLQRLDVPWLQMQVHTGKVTSNGPGTLTAWMPAASLPARPTGLPGGAESEPKSPATGWANTQIKFDRGIEGDLQHSDLTFRDNVRVMFGNVPSTSDSLDADVSPLIAGRYRLRSDELRVVQWQKSDAVEPHLELIAQGQLELQGELFSALAQRLSFDQSREIVVLEGDTRNQARLEYQTAPGAPRNPLVAAKIKYRIRDQAAEAEGITHGVISTGPLLERK